jgi:hypothetical protein
VSKVRALQGVNMTMILLIYIWVVFLLWNAQVWLMYLIARDCDVIHRNFRVCLDSTKSKKNL